VSLDVILFAILNGSIQANAVANCLHVSGLFASVRVSLSCVLTAGFVRLIVIDVPLLPRDDVEEWAVSHDSLKGVRSKVEARFRPDVDTLHLR
jgi:hypothetical protein